MEKDVIALSSPHNNNIDANAKRGTATVRSGSYVDENDAASCKIIKKAQQQQQQNQNAQ